ncbi:MAG: hypothetical protein NTZ76_07065, partial [Actinobacteria bacterium]|nr:hypothetical protein [Actinomycetota bacterium]
GRAFPQPNTDHNHDHDHDNYCANNDNYVHDIHDDNINYFNDDNINNYNCCAAHHIVAFSS